MAAHANLVADLGLVRVGGQVAIIGSKPEAVSLNPRLLMPKEISVHGVFLPVNTAEEKRANHAALYESMVSGALTPVVGETFPLADAAQAHVEVVQPSAGGKVGNVVVVVRDE